MNTINTATKLVTPSKKFKVIYADPPWDIQQKGARGAARHYDLMTLDRIKDMPVADLADDNATLLLWVTNGALPAGLEVMKAWGFEYKTNAAWDKYYMGSASTSEAPTNCSFTAPEGRRHSSSVANAQRCSFRDRNTPASPRR